MPFYAVGADERLNIRWQRARIVSSSTCYSGADDGVLPALADRGRAAGCVTAVAARPLVVDLKVDYIHTGLRLRMRRASVPFAVHGHHIAQPRKG